MEAPPARAQLAERLAVLRRRRLVIGLCVGSVALVALVGSFLQAPQYRATATLQIERQTPDILSMGDLARVDYNWAAYSDFYQTQYKILESEAVAREAASRLDLASHPEFAPEPASPSLYARLRALLPGAGAPRVEPDPTLIAARQVLSRLEIAPVRNSHLVKLSWVSTDPLLAAQVANAVADAYIQFTMQLQYTTSDQASEFLSNQIGTLKKEIAEIEERLQRYGESKRIVSIDDASNITLKALSDVAQRRTEAATQLARAEAVYRAILASPPEALPEVLHSNLIERLKGEYGAYEAQYSEKASIFKADWPEMQTLASKMQQARERLAIEIAGIARQVTLAAEAEYQKALKEVANLDALLSRQEDAAQHLKRDAVEFANLQSEVQKKRETLNTLIARQNELALATRLKDIKATSSNVRVVDPARPPEGPFRPNRKLNLLLGLLLGLGLGVSAAFLLDHLDSTVRTPAELQGVVAFPMLAAIPRHRPASAPLGRARRAAAAPDERVDLVVQHDSHAPVSEAYRELRTALLLSSPGEPPRRILVTSALPEEGKSATALNLAVVLAQMGRKVLLVDTDLRRPRLHRVFDVSHERGVSTVLSGLETDPLSLPLPTGIEHLEIVPSGPIPPNPSELLNSSTFAAMTARYLEHGYDHVVFDSPPVLAVSDPVILGSVVDAVLLVVRAGHTPRPSLKLAAAKFEQSGIRPVGIVLNDLDLDDGGARYYRYYGGYAPPGSPAKETASQGRARA